MTHQENKIPGMLLRTWDFQRLDRLVTELKNVLELDIVSVRPGDSSVAFVQIPGIQSDLVFNEEHQTFEFLNLPVPNRKMLVSMLDGRSVTRWILSIRKSLIPNT